MSRETYETYSAEPEKIDLIAFLAEYFQAFRKFFLGVLILVILMGGGSFLTAKLRYQPMYEAYTSFVVGSNRAVGYSYYDNVTAQQLGKTFPYIVTSGVLKDVVEWFRVGQIAQILHGREHCVQIGRAHV